VERASQQAARDASNFQARMASVGGLTSQFSNPGEKIQTTTDHHGNLVTQFRTQASPEGVVEHQNGDGSTAHIHGSEARESRKGERRKPKAKKSKRAGASP